MSHILSVPLQATVVLAGLATLAAWPPASGTMMLVAIPGATPGLREADAIDAVTAAGGSVLGPGPLRGSVVVKGDRARIARATSGLPVVVLAAPPTMCGATGSGGGS